LPGRVSARSLLLRDQSLLFYSGRSGSRLAHCCLNYW